MVSAPEVTVLTLMATLNVSVQLASKSPEVELYVLVSFMSNILLNRITYFHHGVIGSIMELIVVDPATSWLVSTTNITLIFTTKYLNLNCLALSTA